MFKLPQVPSGKNKRRFEPASEEAIKKVRLQESDDQGEAQPAQQASKGKGKGRAVTIADEEDEVEYIDANNDEFEEDDEDGRFFGSGLTDEQSTILDVFDKADKGGEELTLTPASIKKQLQQLERVIAKNTQLRGKFPDDPHQFIDSEADLDGAIHQLKIFAQNPSMSYPQLINTGAVEQLVGLLAHDNTDISLDVVEVIEELTDEDILDAVEDAEHGRDHLNSFIDTLLQLQILELLVSNMKRLNEEQDSDVEGVYHTLAVFENLISLRPELAEVLISSTDILPWLLKRITRVEYDQNKQYASEILAIVLQDSSSNRMSVLKERDGLDCILQSLSHYMKKEPKDAEELEYLENTYNALCAVLAEPLAKVQFREAEGVDLMVLIAQERLISRTRAIKTLDHAMSGPEGSLNSESFIDANGLTVLFGAFMNKFPQKKNALGAVSIQEQEEHILGIMVSLFSNLGSDTPGRVRLLTKFVENDYEKVDRLLDIRENASNRVKVRIEQDSQLEIEEDEAYLGRLEDGLFTLQLTDYVLAWLVMEDDGVKDHAEVLLKRRGVSFKDITKVLHEYADNMGEQPPNADGSPTQREIVEHLIEYVASL
ncbi:hypothetical protein E3P99_04097 [Wallemia hederae]|uniref:Beta-catenin-like protein 1 N-terminal domain-containing protein n=1 Tax=Wallemia hederae TaxID=1540922 RepID=A0A4T0FAG5_9BASI|nr:hypothetical protein E3P99_04097 [Wallemia hederae]